MFLPELCEEEEEEENRFQGQLAAMVDAEKLRTNSEPSISVHELRQQQKGELLMPSTVTLPYFSLPLPCRQCSAEGITQDASEDQERL